jgi:TrbL/VirB6 plasmid conjugal transfer protein
VGHFCRAPKTWVYRVALNTACNFHRQHRRSFQTPVEPQSQNNTRALISSQNWDEIQILEDFIRSLEELLGRHSGMFASIGQNVFRSFAIILISWFGVKSALSSTQVHSGFHFANFANLLMTIAFGFTMVTYYDSPIPGFGRSFKSLIVDQAVFLSNRIEAASLEEIQERLVVVYSTMEPPTLLDYVYIVRYFLTLSAIVLAQVAVLAVISYGYVAMAVIVLVGPVFIPFFIVPKMEWLFWGWFRAFIQYAFYQVVAQAFVFVFGQLLIHFLDAHPPPFDSLKVAGSSFHSYSCSCRLSMEFSRFHRS